jgi:hypothetical protein
MSELSRISRSLIPKPGSKTLIHGSYDLTRARCVYRSNVITELLEAITSERQISQIIAFTPSTLIQYNVNSSVNITYINEKKIEAIKDYESLENKESIIVIDNIFSRLNYIPAFDHDDDIQIFKTINEIKATVIVTVDSMKDHFDLSNYDYVFHQIFNIRESDRHEQYKICKEFIGVLEENLRKIDDRDFIMITKDKAFLYDSKASKHEEEITETITKKNFYDELELAIYELNTCSVKLTIEI